MILGRSFIAAAVVAVASIGLPAPSAHATGDICRWTLVVYGGMTCEYGDAIRDALLTHPYQTQFFMSGRLTECQADFDVSEWAKCWDGPIGGPVAAYFKLSGIAAGT